MISPVFDSPATTIVRSNIHHMLIESKTRSMTALTANLQHPDDLTHSTSNNIYTAMQSPHWAKAIKDELNALAFNSTRFLTWRENSSRLQMDF